jgi:transcription initiation factor IIF auxiliary subunit
LRDGNPQWAWSASIAAGATTFPEISRVDWTLPTGFLARGSLAGTDNTSGFAIDGTASGSGDVALQATLHFRDGSTLKASHVFRLTPPRRGALRIEQSDRYFGKLAGRDQWDWSVRIAGSLNDLGDISRVTWHLHPTFPNPNRIVTGSAADGFVFAARGWGTFPLRATVTFKDGSTRTLSHNLRFRSPVQTRLILQNSAIPYRVDAGGRTWYNWTAFLRGAEQELARIASVTYVLHPSFRPNRHAITTGKEFGFPFSATGWGTFELAAEVLFNDGSRRILKHNLVFQ